MKPVRSLLTVAAAVALTVGVANAAGATQAASSNKYPVNPAAEQAAGLIAQHNYGTYGHHGPINCAYASAMCTEVAQSDDVFGHYVGHDEPSALFYSNTPGAGNHMRYVLTLPKDPSASNPNQPGKSYAFELSGAEWC